MTTCCPHREHEHHVVSTCQEVTHYPSEDYPCLCSGFAGEQSSDRCARCSHARTMHATARVCKPESGEYCACRREV
jgi:hypothetical protein